MTIVNLAFDQVSKRYRIYGEPNGEGPTRGLLQRIRRWRGSGKDFWALRDVSFAVEAGEALGIIGVNGAGKSTILKLLYNITAPTRGEIRVRGKVSALIEVASGFHPELTGLENIYLNGSLLGMTRSEIRSKLDSIIDFAGVALFIDTPVKRYSSGMFLRLGFAIAAHLDPEILLLDEVLAVGDTAFQAKCIQRIAQLKKSGSTIIFVSHNLGAVEKLCDRTLLINKGQIVKTGLPREVISAYEEQLLVVTPAAGAADTTVPGATGAAEITSVQLFNSAGSRTTRFATGDLIYVRVEVLAHKPLEDVVIEVYFYSIFGNLHTHFSTDTGDRSLDLKSGNSIVEFVCPEIPLEVASFNIEAGLRTRGTTGTETIDHKHGSVINVARGKPVQGSFYTPHSWTLKPSGDNQDGPAAGR